MKKILSQYTVLYAEDDLKVQKNVLEYLNRYFRKVYISNDGKEALEVYNNKQIDTLILDIDMPYIDGLTLAKQIRETNKNIPLIILTAHIHTDKLIRATELNLCKYLVKPVKPNDFKDAIKKLSQQLEYLSSTLFSLGDGYIWNIQSEQLFFKNSLISLSQKEQALLSLLISKHKECTSFTDIMAKLWENNFDVEISVESVKLQVCFLRKKLPKNSIKSVYGKGYILI